MAQYLTLSEYDTLSAGNGSLQEVFSDGEREAEIVAQSDVADSYIGNVAELPLTAWGHDLRRAVAKLVDAELMSRMSRSPDGGGGAGYLLERRAEAERWLSDIARGNAKLLSPSTVDQTPSVYEGGAYVVTAPRRGWGS
jgi:hypothetical protein